MAIKPITIDNKEQVKQEFKDFFAKDLKKPEQLYFCFKCGTDVTGSKPAMELHYYISHSYSHDYIKSWSDDFWNEVKCKS